EGRADRVLAGGHPAHRRAPRGALPAWPPLQGREGRRHPHRAGRQAAGRRRRALSGYGLMVSCSCSRALDALSSSSVTVSSTVAGVSPRKVTVKLLPDSEPSTMWYSSP